MNGSLFLEIKNEYTEHLVETIAPYIYEGLTCIYKDAVRIANECDDGDKTLIIFQKLLQSVGNWNQIRVNEETIRIKQQSNTADYLDDLVKAVVRSNIVLLTYSNSVSNIIGQSFFNSLTTGTFVHRCYTECAKYAHNNPYLFFHDIDPMDYKRNQIIMQSKIQDGISRAVRKILPISMILKEFLVNSANIVQEPPKVELIGLGPTCGTQAGDNFMLPGSGRIGNTFDTFPRQLNIDQRPHDIEARRGPTSDTKLDAKLEREVLKIIKSESAKSDKQKIQAIMNLDKIITSMEPNKPADLSARNFSRKEVSTINKHNNNNNNNNYFVAPNLMEEDCNFYDDLANSRLRQSDVKLININIDDEPTEDISMKKSISGTTMTARGMPGRTGPRMDPETSERIDPSKINLIEDYGPQHGGSKRNMSRNSRK